MQVGLVNNMNERVKRQVRYTRWCHPVLRARGIDRRLLSRSDGLPSYAEYDAH